MPCFELFNQQSAADKENLIPSSANKVTLEAGSTFGWLGMVQGSMANTLCLGIDHFGASAPCQILAEKYGLTVAAINQQISAKFGIKL